MILVAYRSADQELVKLVLHLVGMLGKLQPTCRPDMNVMLTDDLKVLIRCHLLLLQNLLVYKHNIVLSFAPVLIVELQERFSRSGSSSAHLTGPHGHEKHLVIIIIE